jgi:hypothetical protein
MLKQLSRASCCGYSTFENGHCLTQELDIGEIYLKAYGIFLKRLALKRPQAKAAGLGERALALPSFSASDRSCSHSQKQNVPSDLG